MREKLATKPEDCIRLRVRVLLKRRTGAQGRSELKNRGKEGTKKKGVSGNAGFYKVETAQSPGTLRAHMMKPTKKNKRRQGLWKLNLF